MNGTKTNILAWSLLGIFLLAGLWIYERRGIRLGGVLVLPLLLVYALVDLDVVAAFAIAAAAVFLVGHIVYTRTFLYGRRLLYIFLILSIAATLLARRFVDLEMGTFVLALLPGLFAYNLHREGRYLAGASAFMLWFGLLLIATVSVLWVLARPGTDASLVEAAGRAFSSWGDRGTAWLHAHPSLHLAFIDAPGMPAGIAPTGAAGVAALHALREGGVAE